MAADDALPGPVADWWLVPAILRLAIQLSLLVGAWALLVRLLLVVARRAGGTPSRAR